MASHGFEFTFQAKPIPTIGTEEVAKDNKPEEGAGDEEEMESEEGERDEEEEVESEEGARDEEEGEIESEEGSRDEEEIWEASNSKSITSNYSPPPSPTMYAASSSRPLSVSRDPSEARDTNTKRLYSERITNTPPASSQKKWNQVQATSSIRDALEIANDPTYGSPKGLLRFWKKGSQAEVKKFWAHE